MEFEELRNRSFSVVIQVRLENGVAYRLAWTGYTYEQRLKWDWYFKYRSALEQVTNPRATVDLISSSEPAKGRTLRNTLQSRASWLKGKISRWTNRKEQLIISMGQLKKNWNQLFPVEASTQWEESEKAMQLICNKLETLEHELEQIKTKINQVDEKENESRLA